MRAVSFLVVAVAVVACSGEDRPEASSPAAQAREAAAPPPSDKPGTDWAAQRKLPAQSIDPVAPPPEVQPRYASPPPAPGVTLNPPPFAYVGRVAYDARVYAVLSRGQQVFVVGVGDAVDGGYRVQSIHEDRIVLLHLGLGQERSIALSSPASALNPIVPAAPGAVGMTEAASLQVAGRSQVALGEQFDLSVSLDPGLNAALASGYVELQFDPKVLALGAQSLPKATSSGSARLDLTGAYVGHPTHVTIQFRVVTPAPTTTEIRVVPTNIEGADGRELAVDVPQAHRLTIVRPMRPDKGS